MPSFPELASSLPPPGAEIVELRRRNEKRFRMPDGTYQAVFGTNLHYEASPGRWEDVDLSFRPSGDDRVSDRNEVVVKVTADGVAATDRRSRRGIRWSTPRRPDVSGTLARFSDQGLDWQYETTTTGVKLSASVAARRGPQSYEFAYRLVGDHSKKLATNDSGELVGDGFVVPRATVLGADASVREASPWKLLAGGRVGFDFDDSGVSAGALPYVIDPTTVFSSSANDAWHVTGYSGTYPPLSGSSYGHPFATGNDYLPGGGSTSRAFCWTTACYATTTGLTRWDTSSLPDDATVFAAYVGADIGAVDNTDNEALMYSWQPWSPVGTEDLVANPGTTEPPPPFVLGYLTANSFNEIGFRGDNVDGVSKTGFTEMRYLVDGHPTPTGPNGFALTAPPTFKVNYCVANRPTGPYSDHVLADNPISYWPMDETSPGGACDAQGRNHGRTFGGVGIGQTDALAASSMNFDGSSGYVRLSGATSLQPTGGLTVEAWFKTTQSPAYASLFRSRFNGYNLAVNGGRLVASVWGTSPAPYEVVGPSVADGEWHHAALTKTATQLILYLDGVAVGATPHSQPISYAGSGIAIARDGDCNCSYFGGLVDEVAVYDRALPPDRIQVHAMASIANATAGGGGGSATKNLACGTRNQGGSPVTTSTGNFWHTFDDLSVPGRGRAHDLGRTYNSSAAGTDGPFGWGWSSSYTMAATETSPGNVVIRQENGAEVSFKQTGTGTYSSPSWVTATLRAQSWRWVLTREGRDIATFDVIGRLDSRKDLNAYATNVAYNASSQITTVTDPGGRALTFSYGANGKVTSVVDPAGRRVSYAYDGAGNLTEVTDVAGGRTRFSYDGAHRLLTMTDPRGGVVTNTYDAAGRVATQQDITSATVGRTTRFDYTSIPGSTKITEPSGNVIVDTFRRGLLVSHTEGYGTPQAATTTRRYTDPTLGCTSITDPNGRTTTMTYDPAANRTSVTNVSLGRTTTAQYNSFDLPEWVQDAKGTPTTFTYDGAANLMTTSTPLVGTAQSQTTSRAYGDAAHPGDVTALTDPDGKVWRFAYDGAGNLTAATDPIGGITRHCYDGVGRRTAEISPQGSAGGVTCASGRPAPYTTYFATNAFGDLTSATDPLDHATTADYDANRNPRAFTDANGRRTTYDHDLANQLTTVTRADSPVTQLTYAYDADGNVITQRDGAGRATTYTYDARDRVASATDPLGRTSTFGYDAAANLTTLRDPAGRTTTFGYNPANEATSVDYSDLATPDVSVGYDPNGRRTSMTDGTGASTWSWDSLGRLTQSRNGAGATTTYGYDLRDHLTTIAYPGAPTVRRGYDDARRWTSVDDGRGHTTTFGYDADGSQTTTSYANGVTTTNTLDGAGRLGGMATAKGASGLASFTYGRDNANLLTSVTSAGVPPDNHSFGYTNLNQLKSVDAATYNYDAADNLTRLASGTTQGYDVANQLSSANAGGVPTTFGYDATGNRLRAAKPGGGTRYDYDQANRLVRSSPYLDGGRLAAGESHTLAVRSDGTVWGWGSNLTGQLGNGGLLTVSSVPVQATGLSAMVAVAAGANHSLALGNDGRVWRWGANHGQLGSYATTPVQVGGLALAAAVATGPGANHSLVLARDGTVRAFGLNPSGQLGNATTTDSPSPVTVSALSGVTAVAAAANHSMALRADGTVWGWGENNAGQVGDGSTTNRATPVPVSGLSGVVAIAAGRAHSLALRADGTVWAWGENATGQLGNASTTNRTTPVQVSGLSAVASIAAGANHSLALRADDTAWAWGSNDNGQLGNNTSANSAVPVQIAGYPATAPTLDGATALAGGGAHSGAVGADGSVLAWGSGISGQIGNGTLLGSLRPTAVNSFGSAHPVSSTYAYNGDGLRMSKTTTTATSAFSWDLAGGLPLLLKEGSTSYVYGPGGLPLERIDGGGNVLYYHHDQLGSTRLLTDQGGSATATATYDAYGTPTASTGTVTQPFGFAGEYTDAETGFQYLRARYYDPATGQFLSRDPITALTQEPYGYVGGNPLNHIDPSGMDWLSDRLSDSGDWLEDRVKDVADTQMWSLKRLDISAGLTMGFVGVAGGFQGGHFYFQRTNGVGLGFGSNVGFASREYADRQCETYIAGFSPPDVLGGYGQVGANSGGSPNLWDVEGGISFGLPGFVIGKTRSYDSCICTGNPIQLSG